MYMSQYKRSSPKSLDLCELKYFLPKKLGRPLVWDNLFSKLAKFSGKHFLSSDTHKWVCVSGGKKQFFLKILRT